MPGSGVNLLWDETKPAEADIADAAPIRSIETSLRNGLAVEHNWPNASGANFGYHLYGSCRPYYDVQSKVSSSGTDGRLMLTSDTSRLFAVGSGGTALLGGMGMLSVDSWGDAIGGNMQVSRRVMEMGADTVLNTNFLVTFPNSGFSNTPYVVASAWSDPGSAFGIVCSLNNVGPTSFRVRGFRADTGVAYSNFTVNWHAVGVRTT